MPDLMRVLTHTCPDNFHFETEYVSPATGETYHVRYDSRTGWSCTCKGFHYRGYCKHSTDESIREKRCTWGEDAFANTVYKEKECPECGKSTQPFYFGA